MVNYIANNNWSMFAKILRANVMAVTFVCFQVDERPLLIIANMFKINLSVLMAYDKEVFSISC